METNETMSETKLVVCGAEIARQPNGNNLYVVFTGTEQAITDAYNTLWNVNALSGELEWLNASTACVTTSPKQFQRGLLSRELLHLMADDTQCKAYKGSKRGFSTIAQSTAQKLWDSMQQVRVIRPELPYKPYIYSMGYNDPTLDEYHGRS